MQKINTFALSLLVFIHCEKKKIQKRKSVFQKINTKLKKLGNNLSVIATGNNNVFFIMRKQYDKSLF